MSWINVGEVFYMLARKRSRQAAEDFLAALPSLPIRLVLPAADCFIRAARIIVPIQSVLRRSFAVDLAVQQQAGIVTGDP
jgi:hypothetical protein